MHIDTTYTVAATALFSAGVSAFVSWRIALHTIAANRLSIDRQAQLAASLKLADFRQAWINDLRDSIAEMQARYIVPLSNYKAVADYVPGSIDEMMRITAKN